MCVTQVSIPVCTCIFGNISYQVDLICIGVLNSHAGLIYSDVYCQQIKIVYLTYVIYLSKTFANEKRRVNIGRMN